MNAFVSKIQNNFNAVAVISAVNGTDNQRKEITRDLFGAIADGGKALMRTIGDEVRLVYATDIHTVTHTVDVVNKTITSHVLEVESSTVDVSTTVLDGEKLWVAVLRIEYAIAKASVW